MNMNEDEDLINQTCVKIRLFGDDSLINNENIEDLLDDIAGVLITHGFDNSEIVNSILSVNATDILPLDLNEAEIFDYLVDYEKAAYITLPVISDSEDE
jgi:hypothetical protein